MCDQQLWRKLWLALGDEFELIHLVIPNKASINGIINGLATKLPNEAINLVGFSLGGYLATALANKYPDRIKTLSILANVPDKLLTEEVLTRGKIIQWVETWGYSGITLKRAKTFLHTCHQENSWILEQIITMDKTLGGKTLLQQLKSTTERRNLLPHLGDCRFPILFAFGEADHLVNASVVVKLAKERPSIEYIEFSHCGHMLPLEQSQKCALNMYSFFIE